MPKTVITTKVVAVGSDEMVISKKNYKLLKNNLSNVTKNLKQTKEALEGARKALTTYQELLQEARRWTIPYGKGHGMISFYPYIITSIQESQDTQTVHSASGESFQMHGAVEATIKCIGQVFHFDCSTDKGR